MEAPVYVLSWTLDYWYCLSRIHLHRERIIINHLNRIRRIDFNHKFLLQRQLIWFTTIHCWEFVLSTTSTLGAVSVLVLSTSSHTFGYASLGRAPEAYGSCRVCLSVCLSVCLCVCVCVILQRAFLRDGKELSNESCNAITAQHSTTAKLARFLL